MRRPVGVKFVLWFVAWPASVVRWKEVYDWRHDAADNHDLKDELPRIAYAVAKIQKDSDGMAADNRAVRAARVYLCALSSFISAR